MTKEKLDKIKENKLNNKLIVKIGMGTCGISAGAKEIYKELEDRISQGLDIELALVGCIGMCQYEPILEIYREDSRRTYINIDKEKLNRIIEEDILNNNLIEEYLISEDVLNILDDNFLKKQTRIALHNCGNISPINIDEYIQNNGYYALEKVLNNLKPEEVIEEVKKSGIRGRGGAGFPTGIKWEFASKEKGDKFVACNADEGDPGAFMDRSILEGDPHSIIEAMAISAYAIGARKGYIYIRAEYPLAIERLNIAIEQAKEKGLLGKNILGSDFSFDIELRLGAGAFVCGEETALIESIHGRRGEPVLKPPFPTTKGIFGKPTVINNVETYANIPQIILNGSDWFNKIGSEKSKGTKVFAVGGKIVKTGLVEVPIGYKLSDLVNDICDGVPNNKKFKAAQTGGPSGGCIPVDLIDTPLDYDELTAIGSMMGSGGLVVIDEDDCMVDIAKFFLEFTVEESCGKCSPCRIGTTRLYEMLDRLTNGQGNEGDVERLEELSKYISSNSLCGLGMSAPYPVFSTIRHFRDEYEEHIDKKCRAGKCMKNQSTYKIITDKCVGCTACAKECPVDAIKGEVKTPHEINQDICVKCGLCYETCKFDAIVRE